MKKKWKKGEKKKEEKRQPFMMWEEKNWAGSIVVEITNKISEAAENQWNIWVQSTTRAT